MRKYMGAAFVLVSFIAMAGFGFLAMSPQGNMEGCIAALTRGGECPAENGSFASLVFHAGVIKGFSTATVNTGILFIVLLFATFFVLVVHKISENIATPFVTAYSRYKQEVRFFASPLSQRIQRWFSLHENSPAFA